MGDEDLASDDEQYITNPSPPASPEQEQHSEDETTQEEKKRKLSSHENESKPVKKIKTIPKAGKSKNLLIETGREIHKFDAEVQATFLWTCTTHFLNKAPSTTERKIHSSSFMSPSINTNESDDDNDHNMSRFIKQHSSCKILKNWKHIQTFKIIIVCVSAKRAVSILKNIASLKITVAKLFPKHMSLPLQTKALQENSYGIAVGTPNRLLKLWEEGAFNLEKTDFLVMDCFKDGKDFTVCTLKDTSPDLMTFIESAVLPAMEKRKNLKFAFY